MSVRMCLVFIMHTAAINSFANLDRYIQSEPERIQLHVSLFKCKYIRTYVNNNATQ